MTIAELTDDQKARIHKGVEFLDERMPGWAKKLNLTTLNINSIRYCILGQLFNGSYLSGVDYLFNLDDDTNRLSEDGLDIIASEHGFYPHKDDKYEIDGLRNSDRAALKNAFWFSVIRHARQQA